MKWLFGKTAMWLLATIATAAVAFGLGQDASLPEGAGKVILEGACTKCHNLDRVKAKHYDRESWQGIVESMRDKKDGAEVSEDDIKVLAEYLAKNFGEVAGDAAADKSASSGGEGKKILEANCTVCHGLDQVEGQAMSKDDWKTLVEMMIALGAQLKDSEVPVLVDYLSAAYPKK